MLTNSYRSNTCSHLAPLKHVIIYIINAILDLYKFCEMFYQELVADDSYIASIKAI